MPDNAIPSKGYLNEDFRIFHNSDRLGVDVGLHFHSFHKVTVVKHGTGTYMINGRMYDIKPGDVIMVAMNIPHQPSFAKGELYDRYTFYISPSILEGIDIFSLLPGNVLRFSAGHTERLLAMADRVREEMTSDAYASGVVSKLLLLQFVIEIRRSMDSSGRTAKPKRAGNNRMLDLLRYINDHISEPISISDLSGHLYMSRYHMMRVFKSSFGCSIHEYISERRLIYAKELLIKGHSPAETCYMCGYGSYSAFSRAYRSRYGISPGKAMTLKDGGDMITSVLIE